MLSKIDAEFGYYLWWRKLRGGEWKFVPNDRLTRRWDDG